MSVMTSTERPLSTREDAAGRRKRVRRTTLVVTLVALAFSFGFIAMMLYRATH